MKRTVALAFLTIVYSVLFVPDHSFPNEAECITTLFLVRHAEKAASIWEDPGLTLAGTARADELAYIMKDIKLDAVYSTPFKRTKQTVLSTASDKGLKVIHYKPGDKAFLHKVLQAFPGGSVLIAGHSNTIPGLVNELAGQADFKDLDDATYDNLFIACVPTKGKAVVLRMHFGVHAPENTSAFVLDMGRFNTLNEGEYFLTRLDEIRPS